MHNKIKGRKLGRTASHKKALLRNLANQLFEYKEIRTTTAKAKEARSYIERLITYAKKGDVHHRRLAFAFLRNKQTINILFDEIAPVYSDRQGGYTRVVKLGRRSGDAAPISLLQLVDFEKMGETYKKKADKKKGKSSDNRVEKEKSEKEKPTQDQPVVTAEKDVNKQERETELIDKKVEVEEQSESNIEKKDEQGIPEILEKTEDVSEDEFNTLSGKTEEENEEDKKE